MIGLLAFGIWVVEHSQDTPKSTEAVLNLGAINPHESAKPELRRPRAGCWSSGEVERARARIAAVISPLAVSALGG